MGKQVTLRPDWNEIKLEVMEALLRQKFAPGTDLAKKLGETGDGLLVEWNHWNDTYWGVCRGSGENNLGKLIMKIREELRPS